MRVFENIRQAQPEDLQLIPQKERYVLCIDSLLYGVCFVGEEEGILRRVPATKVFLGEIGKQKLYKYIQ